ncbi:MAG: flavin reductase family protein [Micropruina sp.]|uniref:flavin reductase family protein n=1 Tax=Micropruina sp. TaxID=2737536 RepID=UPI0039E60395
MTKDIFTDRDIADGTVRAALTELVRRPLSWVTTTSPDGEPCVAAQSFVTLVSVDPPMVGVSLFGEQQTLANIERSNEFVVSLATAESVRRATLIAGGLHPDIDEFTAGLPLETADTVGVQRPSDSSVHLECGLQTVLNFGNGHLVIGRLTALVVDGDTARDGVQLVADSLAGVGG